MNSWLEGLKAGDMVAVHSHFMGTTMRPVERVTATQIVVNGVKYRKRDGRTTGARGYDTPQLVNQSEEWVKTLLGAEKRKVLRQQIQEAALRCSETARLRHVLALLTCPTTASKGPR